MDNDSIIETYLRDWCYSEVEEALNVARADERRKFIDFMAEHTHCRTDCENFLCCDGKRCWNKYLDMYEQKEQKNESKIHN